MKASRKKFRRFAPRSERAISEGPPEKVAVRLTDFAHQGEALGRVDGKVIFAAYGIPGEEVLAEVREEKPSYAIAEVVEVATPSPDRVEPRCPHFGSCGGCQLQHIAYPRQLELKRRVVEEQLRRIGKLVEPPVSPMVGMKDPWHYRNHDRFTVRGGVVGFTHWHTHRLIPIDWCYITDPWINEAKKSLEGKVAGLRQLSVRRGVNTGTYLIHPDLSDREGVSLETAQPMLEEALFGVRFQASAASFFQVNTRQAERMAALVRDRLELKGTETVLDAYAGVGTFAALFAPFCARVVAIEESTAAVRDAQVNLRDFRNVEMIEGKTEDVLATLPFRPEAVILDPPRAGCEPPALEALGRMQPARIVYVSCDPATLARDLHELVLQGFRLVDVTPLDMFPQTYHIESVTTLERAGKDAIVLASTSPRRRELVQRLGVPVQVLSPSGVDEPPLEGDQPPIEYAANLAREKALSLARRARVPVMGADTVVVLDGRVLGKPADPDEARSMLRALKGREHVVATAVAMAEPGGERVHAEALETRVRMREYSDAEIEAYVATGDPMDKAGAYAIQHPGFHPVESISGCYLNVVGLPLCLADRLLRQAGVAPRGPNQNPGPPQCSYCAEERVRIMLPLSESS